LRNHPRYEAQVQCSGEVHRLQWVSGELTACDHADPEGERALIGLGGESCRCMDLLDGWARHADDLRVLTLSSRGPGDQLQWSYPAAIGGPRSAPGIPMLHQGPVLRRVAVTSMPVGYQIVGRGGTSPALPSSDQLPFLLALDSGVAARLALTVAATWAERLAGGDPRAAAARPALTAALYGRVASVIRSWFGLSPSAVEVEMISPDEEPSVSCADRGVRVRLPLVWLVDVWARGMAVTVDHFVVRVLQSDADRWELLAVQPGSWTARRVKVSLA
jgi:hypothetical protein